MRCGRLVEHFPYCPMHLDEVLGVRVGPSTIPGAGDGVFATRDLPKGWTLPYGGELVRRETIDKRYPEEGSEYVFEVSPSLLLDAQCKRGIGSMMNQPAKRKHPSGGFDRWCMDKQLRALQAGDTTHEDVCPVLFQLTRCVKKGAELFAPYGNAEWSREFDRAKADAELDFDLGPDQGTDLGPDQGAELEAKSAKMLQAASFVEAGSRVKQAKVAKGAKRGSRGQRGQRDQRDQSGQSGQRGQSGQGVKGVKVYKV